MPAVSGETRPIFSWRHGEATKICELALNQSCACDPHSPAFNVYKIFYAQTVVSLDDYLSKCRVFNIHQRTARKVFSVDMQIFSVIHILIRSLVESLCLGAQRCIITRRCLRTFLMDNGEAQKSICFCKTN